MAKMYDIELSEDDQNLAIEMGLEEYLEEEELKEKEPKGGKK